MSIQPSEDTIVAVSTPPGRGGIGIVRLSGPDSLAIASRLLRLSAPLEPARARFAQVLDLSQPSSTSESDATASVIDEAIATAFFAPHSYTGGDIVEIAAHGSPIVLEAIVRGALTLGARLAGPGEFTQRAFLSGRLDLTQAEAVADLIAAQTLDQARVAAQQLGGAMSRRVAPAKESLLHLIAFLEAGMDFASGELDDVDVVSPETIASALESTCTPLEQLAASFRRGQMLRTGAALALVGLPNAGKSSLFNRLLARDRAIVTALPGTTRDTVEESLELGGVPLRLIDTAGLRDATEHNTGHNNSAPNPNPLDEAELQGIARSREALADADLILLIHDATHPVTAAEHALALSLEGRPHLLIRNKIDLVADASPASEADSLQSEAHSQSNASHWLPTSALTGAGLDELRAAILRQLHAEGGLADAGALNNLRQQQAVATTLAALREAAAANREGLPHEILLLDLHAALRALDSLTGLTTADDILGRIFSTFCIGK